jgi:hypothetical protein
MFSSKRPGGLARTIAICAAVGGLLAGCSGAKAPTAAPDVPAIPTTAAPAPTNQTIPSEPPTTSTTSTAAPAPAAPSTDARTKVNSADPVDPAEYHSADWGGQGQLYSSPGGGVFFQTPSGHIVCNWGGGGDGLVCGAKNRGNPPPEDPSCHLSWITDYVNIGSNGVLNGMCVGGIMTPYGAVVLPYGKVLRFNDFGCLSEQSGVTCVSLSAGQGFQLSQRTFNVIPPS